MHCLETLDSGFYVLSEINFSSLHNWNEGMYHNFYQLEVIPCGVLYI